MGVVLAALIWLAPGLDQDQARIYAQAIYTEASKHRIDPLLVVALAYRESRLNSSVSSKGNHGLLQVRVSKTNHPQYLGKEALLLNPKLNVELGVKLLSYWRRYHQLYCHDHKDPVHPWWSHYQHGKQVTSADSGFRVHQLYTKLERMFRSRVSS